MASSRTRNAVPIGHASRGSRHDLGHRTDFACTGLRARRLSSTAASGMDESSERTPRWQSADKTVDSNLVMNARGSIAAMYLSGSRPRCGVMWRRVLRSWPFWVFRAPKSADTVDKPASIARQSVLHIVVNESSAEGGPVHHRDSRPHRVLRVCHVTSPLSSTSWRPGAVRGHARRTARAAGPGAPIDGTAGAV